MKNKKQGGNEPCFLFCALLSVQLLLIIKPLSFSYGAVQAQGDGS